jgi:hypothetical protein
MFAESYSSAESMLDALSALHQPVIIQEYIETEGTDVRAFVIGNEVIASMKRHAVEGEKRANIHAGGKGTACRLDEKTKKIAVKTASVIGAGICAVDILQSKKGPLVIEVNLSPGLQGITAATKLNVADKIAKYLYEETKKFVASELPSEAVVLGDLSKGESQNIVTNIELKDGKIILPEVVTKLSRIDKRDEITISVGRNSFLVQRNAPLKVSLGANVATKKMRLKLR